MTRAFVQLAWSRMRLRRTIRDDDDYYWRDFKKRKRRAEKFNPCRSRIESNRVHYGWGCFAVSASRSHHQLSSRRKPGPTYQGASWIMGPGARGNARHYTIAAFRRGRRDDKKDATPSSGRACGWAWSGCVC